MNPSPDERFMRHALSLARRGIGRVSPNPSVGCVLVRDDHVIAAARTEDGGRPHAEARALAEAGAMARGATAYVTLEPCAHQGATASCAEALVAAGVARVVIALGDPDPRTDGAGARRLRAAGIEVDEGICRPEAEAINAGFLKRVRHGLPWIGLKLATSADGYMARRDGGSPWITGEAARNFGHVLRAEHDGILTGIGTVLADDPLLTCRLPGRERERRIRVVLDRALRTPSTGRLARSIDAGPVWIVTGAASPAARERELAACGMRVLRLADPSPTNVARALAGEGLTRLLVEAGPSLSHAFLPLADRLHWFRAPMRLGESGDAAFGTPEEKLAGMPRESLRLFGVDRLETYRPG